MTVLTYGHRRRAGAGVRHSDSTEDKRSDDMTNEERRQHVTSGQVERRYNRMEMETVREGLSLSDTMRKGLDDMLSRLDRQEDSHESQKERDCH